MEKLKEKLSVNTGILAVLYILIGAAAAIGVVSGIGSTCTTFDVFTMGGSSWWDLPSFAIIEQTQPFFIISYVVTWIVAITWGILIWALKQGKSWFYNIALLTSLAGFISGFIPSWILFYEDYLSYGQSGMFFTPSWFRMIGNFIILIYLLIPKVRKGIRNFIEEKSFSTGASVGSQVSQAAFVLIGFGIVVLSYSFLMPLTHAVWSSPDVSLWLGINFEQLLFLGGILCILLGIITFITGYLLKIAYPPNPTLI